MFGNLREFLRGEQALSSMPGSLVGDREVQIAVVTILLDIAHVDGQVTAGELTTLVSSITRHFNLETHSPDSVNEMLDIAEGLRLDKAKLSTLTDFIVHTFSTEQRQIVLTTIWQIVAADNRTAELELHYAATLRNRLGLSLEQAMEAREMAEAEGL